MDEEKLAKYREAGKIAAEAREFGKELIENGASRLEIVRKTEKKIKELGGGLAFPVNLSVDEVGAHDTAGINEKREVEGGLIKLDVGVHIDGFIADTATTVSMDSKQDKMVDAVEKALRKAVSMMKPGQKVKTISAKVEDTIKDFGYNPVKNLTGHGLGKYDLHANIQFPNVRNDIDYELKVGDIFALEPFATDGAGKVSESGRVLIYRWNDNAPTRSREGRKILKMAEDEFKKLPFAKRWLKDRISKLKLNMALRQLTNKDALYKYPVLKEAGSGDITQAEHTIIVGEEPEITTEI